MLEAPASTAPHLFHRSARPRGTDRWATVSLSGASMTLMKSYGAHTANELVVRPSRVRVPGPAIVGVK